MKTAAFLLPLLIFSIAVSQGSHQTEAAPAIVSIENSEWYYWKNSGSDTCLVWLGGGKAFADHVTINPYYLESLNTIRYIQDLSTQYSVLALYKGPEVEYVYEAESEVNVLSYYDNSRFLHEIYEWIKENGYAYSYLVGYSTGGTVVGYELAVRDRNTWASPNGGIIVSGRVDQSMKHWKGTSIYESADYARNIRANILLIYGRIWSEDLWPQGRGYYQNAPNSGSIDGRPYHKEWHLLNESGHEVWTQEQTGIYDPTAFHITVNFIEKSKTLSFKSVEEAISRAVNGSGFMPESKMGVYIADVKSPSKVNPGQLFKIKVKVRYTFIEETRIATALWDMESENLFSASESIIQGDGVKEYLQSVYAPSNEKNWSLAAVALSWSNNQLVLTKPVLFKVTVSDKHLLSVESGYSNISIVIDGATLRTDREGEVQIEVDPGMHMIETQEVVPLDKGSRLVFRNWQDGENSSRITVTVTGDETVRPVYVRQYYVAVNSSHAETEGTGWYDENNRVRIAIRPNSSRNNAGIFQAMHAFEGWSGDVDGVDTQVEITVDRPMLIIAAWRMRYDFLIQNIVVLSIAICAALTAIFGYRSSRASH